MSNYHESDFVSLDKRLAEMDSARRAKIEEGAAAILEQIRLADLRKAMSATQAELAGKIGMKQAEISRIENNLSTVQLRTIERYARGLGGEIKLIVEFPEGTRAEIPIRAGKPVKSRIRMASRRPPEAAE